LLAAKPSSLPPAHATASAIVAKTAEHRNDPPSGEVRSTMRLRLLFVLGALALAACSSTIPHLNPRPNVALVKQQASLDLALAPEVVDRFDVAVGSGMVHVEAWRASLETGFRNAFDEAFPKKQGSVADWTLQIDEARLELGNFEHKEARIRYAATLRRNDGTVLRPSGIASRAAPAFAGFSASTSYVLERDIAASIDAMYEQLAKELLSAPPSPVPTATATVDAKRCVPGQSVACAGPKGCSGFQVCAADGAKFAPCSCD
jgi:hypothetical protein